MKENNYSFRCSGESGGSLEEGVILKEKEKKIVVFYRVGSEIKKTELTQEKIEEIAKRDGLQIEKSKSRKILEELGLRMPDNYFPKNKPAFLIIKRVFPNFNWKQKNGQTFLSNYPDLKPRKSHASLAEVTLGAIVLIFLGISS